MAKKPPAASKKTRTKPGVPGESGNKNRRQRKGAKASGQDENLPGMGHNGPPANGGGKEEPKLSARERKALLIQHVGDYKKVLERKKKADADLKNACKLIKAEGGKRQVARVKAYIQLESPEGEASIREEFADIVEIAKWVGSPIGTQFKMDLDEPDRTPAVDRAYTEGETAGMAGEVAKPPYDPTVPQHGEWLSGWHAGNAARIRASIKAPEAPEDPSPPVPSDDQGDAAQA